LTPIRLIPNWFPSAARSAQTGWSTRCCSASRTPRKSTGCYQACRPPAARSRCRLSQSCSSVTASSRMSISTGIRLPFLCRSACLIPATCRWPEWRKRERWRIRPCQATRLCRTGPKATESRSSELACLKLAIERADFSTASRKAVRGFIGSPEWSSATITLGACCPGVALIRECTCGCSSIRPCERISLEAPLGHQPFLLTFGEARHQCSQRDQWPCCPQKTSPTTTIPLKYWWYSLLPVFSQKLKNPSLNRNLVRAKNQCSQTEQ